MSEACIVIRAEITSTAGGAAYQSWLRRRIATLEVQQYRRIELAVEQKRALDASIVRAQTELENLRAQQNIEIVR